MQPENNSIGITGISLSRAQSVLSMDGVDGLGRRCECVLKEVADDGGGWSIA